MIAGFAVALRNCQPCRIADIPRISFHDFRNWVVSQTSEDGRLKALFAKPLDKSVFTLYAVFADDPEGILYVTSTEVGSSYPAITPDCLQAHWFEREIHEQWDIQPVGHPWLKPIRFLARSDEPAKNSKPGVTDYFQIEGDEVHEVAVGPVHAGIIEPGHFRFQCHGEKVLHLEISLGYQHRGIENALTGGPSKRTIHYMETLAGDTTIGHTLAYCQAVEALCRCRLSEEDLALRGIALELERLANHTGDLGALANDVGYLPTASYCGRIRGDFLNMTALICGNRFGRGWIRPGGSLFDVEPGRVDELRKRLKIASKDVTGAVNLLWENPSVMARFENTGVLSKDICKQFGIVGVAARACGLEWDLRYNFPTGIYQFSHIPVSVGTSGDVFGRAYVRWLEIQRSLDFIEEHLTRLPERAFRSECGILQPGSFVVSLSEGWRGSICHVAETDASGRFAYYKVIDPSYHNWIGLAMAMRGQQISDFPLCNKSFNLSYCGHDL